MSLVEVMVVIAIVLTLTSVLAIGVYSIWEQSRVDTTRLLLGRLGASVEIYAVRTGHPPSQAEGLAPLGIEIPTDAWGRPFSYRTPGPDGAAYELMSLGRDGEEGGADLDEDLVWSPPRK
jgi:general secretion pathway protein G